MNEKGAFFSQEQVLEMERKKNAKVPGGEGTEKGRKLQIVALEDRLYLLFILFLPMPASGLALLVFCVMYVPVPLTREASCISISICILPWFYHYLKLANLTTPIYVKTQCWGARCRNPEGSNCGKQKRAEVVLELTLGWGLAVSGGNLCCSNT